MACCKKYKALILKYVPCISKYMPYIFRQKQHLIFSNLQNYFITLFFPSIIYMPLRSVEDNFERFTFLLTRRPSSV